MNQIICDICGSAYPEGYDRCPVCSYPRQGGEKIVAAGVVEAAREKVTGGQFSAKNVKKRRKAQKKAALAAGVAAADVPVDDEELEEDVPVAEKPQRNPNRPLWIVIIILLLSIILVGAYIAFRFGQGMGLFLPTQTEAPTTTASVPTETTVPPTVPCAGINLDTTVIALDDVGQQHQIGLRLIPGKTTDVPVFVSQDPAVAEVDENGMLTAVGYGQTTVTITCGEIVQECTVMCWFADATTAPPETTAPTEPPETTKATEATEPAVLKLDQEDVSCFTEGEVFTLYARFGGKSVSRSKVTWSTSDPKIAKVDNGTVTAVGKGTATITAEYNGMKAVCTVRCRFENAAGNGDQEQGGQQEDQGSQSNTDWKASHSDVSIKVGEVFRLQVTNSAGETAKAIWTMDVDGVVSIDGRTVTGRAPGTVTLTTVVDGVTMTCIVRVK